MDPCPIETRFFTFYSFRGGVGRTMALYNCACVLAGQGRRVLMIDFDLEAPGLTVFLPRVQEKDKRGSTSKTRTGKPPRKTVGLVELVSEYVNSPKIWPLGRPGHPEAISRYVVDLPIPPKALTPGVKGRLALMPAGRIDSNFEARLSRLHWDTTPLRERRDALFRHVREVIVRSKAFDYVLVDSRTGFSDEGYISSRILADDLAVLTGLNDQNIKGTARFLRQVDAWNRRARKGEQKLRVLLIASPVPEWEEEARQTRLAQVRRLLKAELGQKIDFTLSLPYNPRLALFEEAMVSGFPDSALAGAYRDLSERLRRLANDDAERWIHDLLVAFPSPGARREGEVAQPDLTRVLHALRSLKGLGRKDFPGFASLAAERATQTDPSSPETRDLFEFILNCLPDDPQYRLAFARWLRRAKTPEARREALTQLQSAARLARRAGKGSQSLLVSIELERGMCLRRTASGNMRAGRR